MKISPARIAAFEILMKVEQEKAFSSALLPHYEENLSPKDRGLCHALVLGVLRNQIYLDKIITEYAKKKKLDDAVKISLRVGLFQLLFLDKVPDYSAINESVNLVQRAKKTSAKGLVNAVLRRATREKTKLSYASETEKIAVESSTPLWLFERWIEQFGFEEAAKLAAANNETPLLCFRATQKADENTLEELCVSGVEIEMSPIVPDAWRVIQTSELLFEYAGQGKIYFQDEGSQLVGQTINLQRGERFIDVCAAPASKLSQIAGRYRESENFIVGGDLYAHRLRIVDEILTKTGANDNVSILAYDAADSLPFAAESFDAVLVDAPCSGTGTIRHNPEIRYFLSENDFADLSAKQLSILENASKLLKPGGRLIYSTCSLEVVENEAVCERFLFANTDFQKNSPAFPERFKTGENYIRTFPQRDETDGFFIASFEKK